MPPNSIPEHRDLFFVPPEDAVEGERAFDQFVAEHKRECAQRPRGSAEFGTSRQFTVPNRRSIASMHVEITWPHDIHDSVEWPDEEYPHDLCNYRQD